MVQWDQVALAALLGGLLALERRAFLQAMFARPLVAATAMGVVLGDVRSGVMVGTVLELHFLGSASLGAALPDHDTLAATGSAAAAVALADATGGGSTPAIWSLSLLLFVGLGRTGRHLDRQLEWASARMAQRALALTEAGQLDRAMRSHVWAMGPTFALFGALTGLCSMIGYLLAPAFELVPLGALRGLAWAYPAMASVAAAIAARGSRAKRALAWAGLAAVLVTVVAAVGSVPLGLRGHP